MTDTAALVRLLQLVSPALPVGAYAYSQGLEHAVQAGWIRNHDGARDWITGVLEHSLCGLDLPVLRRMHLAWVAQDLRALEYWSRFLSASRESAELRVEDHQIGTAMARLLADLDVPGAGEWRRHDHLSWALMFSLAAVHWEIPLPLAAEGYAWSWCENQVAAAIKLVPLGQTDGQRILRVCADRIPALCARAMETEEEDIGQLAAALAIGSALHERQYSRLFRS